MHFCRYSHDKIPPFFPVVFHVVNSGEASAHLLPQ